MGLSGAQVTSIEASEAIYESTKSRLGSFKNVALVHSTFQNYLNNELPKLNPTFDLIFIDGHHHGPALLRYVELLLPHLSRAGLLVCDDVHWSPDMESAWATIRQDEAWTMTLDVFEMGVATRRPGLTRMDVNVVLRGHPKPVL